MKALRATGERQVEVLDLPVPHPEPGEVVIQMKSTGICGSDLHQYRRPTKWHLDGGFISGHEPCGVIAEVGPGVSETFALEDGPEAFRLAADANAGKVMFRFA